MNMQVTRRGAMVSGLAAAGCAVVERLKAPEPPKLYEGPLPAWSKVPGTEFRGKQDDVVVLPSGAGWYGNGSGKLYRTTDGGATWTEAWSRPGTYIRALGFVDDNTGFLGNIAPDYFPNVTDPVSLYLTSDGGKTWTPASAPEGPAPKGVCAIDVLRAEFINAGVLDRRVTVRAGGRVGGPAVLMTSRELGKSWRSQDLSALTGMVLDVKFVNERTGFICGASSTSSKESNAVILKTSDGGETWRRVYVGTRPWEITWKTAWPTSRIGYVTIQNYNPEKTVSQRYVAKTTDGGETWTELPVIDSHPWRAFGIAFMDERTGWIGGTTTGVQTRDGGLTWTPVEMGKAVNKIRVVPKPTGTDVYAIGTELNRLQIPATA